MKDLIPYIFWPWFTISCVVLIRRRVTGGSWRAQAPETTTPPVEFPPPPAAGPDPAPVPAPTPTPDATAAAHEPTTAAEPAPTPRPRPVAVVDPDRPAARSLAEALDGIEMPCGLSPLMGAGTVEPRRVNFFVTGVAPETVGTALGDEFERLGFTITPADDRSIEAERGPDLVTATLVSAALTSDLVMAEHHPSAPEGAVVVELKLA